MGKTQGKARKTTVGRSSRTPYKHWLLNSHLGKVAGVLSMRKSSVPAKPPLLIIDMCAGDGLDTDDHTSSPTIIMKHANWLANKGIDVCTVLVEKSYSTFESLEQNVNKKYVHPRNNLKLINADCREIQIKPVSANQAIFINADPNSIADMPLSERLISQLTPTTTITMTLGCNVGGLKRLPFEERKHWFTYTSAFVDSLPHWHDAILIELTNDASQWAYMSRFPTKWAHAAKLDAIKKGNALFGEGKVLACSKQDDWDEFEEMTSRLFLTRKEREQDGH